MYKIIMHIIIQTPIMIKLMKWLDLHLWMLLEGCWAKDQELLFQMNKIFPITFPRYAHKNTEKRDIFITQEVLEINLIVENCKII